jgi:NADPH-dependent F420 reductase
VIRSGTIVSFSSIAVLGGTGQQGRGLAQRFARAGVPVIVGSRDPSRAREMVSGWKVPVPIETDSNAGAASRADVVVLTVPFTSLDALLDDVRAHFRPGALVVDVTVPLTFTGPTFQMADVAEGSACEHVKARLPETVGLAGAFKTLPAHVLDDVDEPLECDEFVCGDSADVRARASELVATLPGLRPVDVGPLARGRYIEHATALAIAINRRHKIHRARFRVVGLG